MTLVDRFICRREGHKPALTFTSGTLRPDWYIAPCRVCGKLISWNVDGTELRSA